MPRKVLQIVLFNIHNMGEMRKQGRNLDKGNGQICMYTWQIHVFATSVAIVPNSKSKVKAVRANIQDSCQIGNDLYMVVDLVGRQDLVNASKWLTVNLFPSIQRSSISTVIEVFFRCTTLLHDREHVVKDFSRSFRAKKKERTILQLLGISSALCLRRNNHPKAYFWDLYERPNMEIGGNKWQTMVLQYYFSVEYQPNLLKKSSSKMSTLSRKVVEKSYVLLEYISWTATACISFRSCLSNRRGK